LLAFVALGITLPIRAMVQAIAILFTLMVFGAGFVALAGVLSLRLVRAARREQLLRWLAPWSIKGLLIPIALWSLMNVGISWSLAPFMPEVQIALNRGQGWLAAFLTCCGTGVFVICSYWCAVTLGWMLVRTEPATSDAARQEFRALCLTCLLGLCIPAGIVLSLGGWLMLGFAASIILAPLAAYAPGILQAPKTPPMYASAIARMKFGKYPEAELEIIRQLEKCEDDFEGWMMLAELYANHFHDLDEAERTLLELCDQPHITSSQLSVALHRLADWYLKLAQDPDAARRALQVICDRLKGTHLAHMAQLRIRQLPSSVEELRDQQGAKSVPLPALGDSLDEAPPPPDSGRDRQKAAQDANACVARLKEDSDNVTVREKLARLFAEHLDRADLGIEQLMLLVDMPDQPDGRKAEWLGLAAAWQIRYRQDFDAGRRVLERLIAEFPNTPQTLAARRRVRLLDQKLGRKAG
jgi:hypothetical protein